MLHFNIPFSYNKQYLKTEQCSTVNCLNSPPGISIQMPNIYFDLFKYHKTPAAPATSHK